MIYCSESLCTKLTVGDEKNPILRTITQHVETVMGGHNADVVRYGVLGIPDDCRTVVNVDGFIEHGHEVLTVTWGRQHQTRNNPAHSHIPQTVVRGAVSTCETSPIQHDSHTRMVQPGIHKELVKSTIKEGRVESHNGV